MRSALNGLLGAPSIIGRIEGSVWQIERSKRGRCRLLSRMSYLGAADTVKKIAANRPCPFGRPGACVRISGLLSTDQRLSDEQGMALVGEQIALGLDAAGKAGERAARADHAVAGGDDRDRVAAVGGADCA